MVTYCMIPSGKPICNPNGIEPQSPATPLVMGKSWSRRFGVGFTPQQEGRSHEKAEEDFSTPRRKRPSRLGFNSVVTPVSSG